MNSKFQNALIQKNKGTPPIWFMRQAGRYHSHYQNLRKKHSFMELCKEPQLAAEVALGPIQDFDFDVSILFSDLLFPLEALGMGLEYRDDGPHIGTQLTLQNLQHLKPVNEAAEFMMFQKHAVVETRKRLPQSKSLIGFVGGLWTLFVYAVEGSHSGNMIPSKTQPELMRDFFKILIPLLEKNIQLQLDGGAEVVMIFDTSVGEISPLLFHQEMVPHLVSLAQKFPQRLGYYSKGTQRSFYSPTLTRAPWAGLGLDHRWDLPGVLKEKMSPGFVQGNFDQAFLFCEESDFKKLLKSYMETFKALSEDQRAAWVCGLGHGVLPKTPEKNVHLFIETIRKEF